MSAGPIVGDMLLDEPAVLDFDPIDLDDIDDLSPDDEIQLFD